MVNVVDANLAAKIPPNEFQSKIIQRLGVRLDWLMLRTVVFITNMNTVKQLAESVGVLTEAYGEFKEKLQAPPILEPEKFLVVTQKAHNQVVSHLELLRTAVANLPQDEPERTDVSLLLIYKAANVYSLAALLYVFVDSEGERVLHKYYGHAAGERLHLSAVQTVSRMVNIYILADKNWKDAANASTFAQELTLVKDALHRTGERLYSGILVPCNHIVKVWIESRRGKRLRDFGETCQVYRGIHGIRLSALNVSIAEQRALVRMRLERYERSKEQLKAELTLGKKVRPNELNLIMTRAEAGHYKD